MISVIILFIQIRFILKLFFKQFFFLLLVCFFCRQLLAFITFLYFLKKLSQHQYWLNFGRHSRPNLPNIEFLLIVFLKNIFAFNSLFYLENFTLKQIKRQRYLNTLYKLTQTTTMTEQAFTSYSRLINSKKMHTFNINFKLPRWILFAIFVGLLLFFIKLKTIDYR